MTSRIRLYGIGSPFHGDQSGLRLVEEMIRDGFSPDIDGNVFDFQVLDRPGWGLLDCLRGPDPVILVDAMVSGSSPGTIRRIALPDLPHSLSTVSSHSIGVLPVLALGKVLGQLPPCLFLYGVEIAPFSPSAPNILRTTPDKETSLALRRAILMDLPRLLSSGCPPGPRPSEKQQSSHRGKIVRSLKRSSDFGAKKREPSD